MSTSTILFVGNPASGKSVLLNGLIGKVYFKCSCGRWQIDKCTIGDITYIKTSWVPCANNDKKQQMVATIETALKQNGSARIFFLVTLVCGLFGIDDVATLDFFLHCMPEIKFGVIVNFVQKEMPKDYQDLLELRFRGMLGVKYVYWFPRIKEIEDEEDTLLHLPQSFLDFIESVPETITNPSKNAKNRQTEEIQTEQPLSMDVEFGTLDLSSFECLHCCTDNLPYSINDSLVFCQAIPFRRLPENFSDAEKAIYIYTLELRPSEESIYKKLNTDLTNPYRTNDTISKWSPFIGFLIKGLQEQEKWVSHNSVLYRGINKNLVKEFKKKYIVGKVFYWYGFTSTTEIKEKATAFFHNTKESTLFEISNCLSGRKIFEFSSRNEREVLFPPLSKFKIKRIAKEESSFITIVYIEQVPSDDIFGLEQ